ncbi:MAG: hypothetical protein ACM3YM_05775 [Sphingomonadales bacterium]
MRDEMDARLWAEHGSEFSAAVAGLLGQVRTAFAKLYEIQYDAPWRRETKRDADRTRSTASCHGA